MKVWVQFDNGLSEEYENVRLVGKHEATGLLRIEIRDAEGCLEREVYYPMDDIMKMTVIHESK